jgi:ribonuclease R
MKRKNSRASQLVSGLVKRNPDGFGFLIPDESEHPDVYLPRAEMTGIITNDRLLVKVNFEKGRERLSGEVKEVIQRSTKTVVGSFFRLNQDRGIIRDDSKSWGNDLIILQKDSLDCANGELVAAEIVSYANEPQGFKGRVIERLGQGDDPLMDLKRVLHSQSIPQEFSSATLREVSQFAPEVDSAEFRHRADLRREAFITIDGATAKDFDDAILVKKMGANYLLYVAIADVSHYVKSGSSLDQDAYSRGTSVYLPNFVVPMLPEILSNELCSLKPRVPRLALVAEMKLDGSASLRDVRFYEAVIESKARVTYGEAQEAIDGRANSTTEPVVKEILLAAELARILMEKRFREGSLDLEIPETQVLVDGRGIPTDIIRSERLFAHKLIEELMLMANIAVARFLGESDIPCLYRIHESPNIQALGILERYLQAHGGQVDLSGGHNLQKRLTQTLRKFTGQPQAVILNILALRSMAQAKYSPHNVGHFGLGFEHYAHFTSPIRRYPDLIVHRQVKSKILANKYRQRSTVEQLESQGQFLSACEQRAAKAERQVIGIKKARFIKQHVGESFEGIISSVTRFGVFVLLRKFEVDGLVKIENLAKEKMFFDEERLMLVAGRSGLKYKIGDPMKVVVGSVNVELGQIDFIPDRTSGELPKKTKETENNSAGREFWLQRLDAAIAKKKHEGPSKPSRGKEDRAQKTKKGGRKKPKLANKKFAKVKSSSSQRSSRR